MTVEDRAAMFDALASAFTHQWESGQWSWWSRNPAGGELRATRAEAVADLVAWANKINTLRRRAALPLLVPPVAAPCDSTSAPTNPTGSPGPSS